jgi:hypothetical protein
MYGIFSIGWAGFLILGIQISLIAAVFLGLEYIIFHRKIYRRLSMLEKHIASMNRDSDGIANEVNSHKE